MTCPDCHTNMEKVIAGTDEDGDVVAYDNPYWKCPKCKIELEEDEDEGNI